MLSLQILAHVGEVSVDALLHGLAFLRQKNLIEMEKKSGIAEIQNSITSENTNASAHTLAWP